MTDTIDLSTAAPLSEWKTRDGRKAVFGCWNKYAGIMKVVGWIDGYPASWKKDGGYISETVGGSDIVAPWPKEPVCFETEIENILGTPMGNMGILKDSILTPLIGKRVRVTVEELP